MSAGRYSFTINQGTTIEFEVVYKDSELNPVNISDFHSRMQIRPDYADFTDEVNICLSSSLDVDGSGLYMNGPSGSIVVYMSAAKTEEFNFDEGLYDLELYSGSFVERLLEGKVKIRREVTRKQNIC